jgi:hypothetical protein
MDEVLEELREVKDTLKTILQILENNQSSSNNMDRHISRIESCINFPVTVLNSFIKPNKTRK